MGVFVDRTEEYPFDYVHPEARKVGLTWCHLWADSVDELHAFAAWVGLPRSRFHVSRSGPHYDLTPDEREQALDLGAGAWDFARWREATHGRNAP
jgi:hypothetical protein